MELIVSEIKELEPINFNYEELKENLSEKLKVYANAVYTEDTIKEAEKDRANLNKLSKALNDKKIEIKKQVLKPFEDYENKTKELITMIADANSNIDKQIKSFEQKQKDDKLKQIVEIFENNVGELVDIFNFDKIYNEQWLNKTYTIKKVEADILHSITKANQDLNVIQNLDVNTELETRLTSYYFNEANLNLSATMQEKTRIEEEQKKVEELQKKQKNAQSITKSEESITKSTQSITKSEEKQQIDFRVWVTQEQKLILKEFLIKNNIKYGSVK